MTIARWLAGLLVAGAGVYATLLRRRQLAWGVTAAEAAEHLPGDEVVPTADLIATRGITIRAIPEDVWGWVAQLGQGRGGFYSYDVLENLVGCDIHSADRIVPEWQDPQVGDEVHLHPEVALEVAAVDPGRALVLQGAVSATGSQEAPPYDFAWAFIVTAAEPGTTRLLVRERYAYTEPWAASLVEPVAVVSFVMTQRMLRGIRDRAQRRR